MTYKSSILTGVLSFLQVVLIAQDNQLEVHNDWRLKKDTDGVKVSTRWIEADDDRQARQILAQMDVPTSIQTIIDVIKDDKSATSWVNRAKDFYNFDFETNDLWHTYTELSIPWPFNNKDLVTRNEIEYIPQTERVKISITGVPDHLPEKKSIGRIPHFEGSWELTQIDHRTVRVEYFIFTKQEPILPRFVLDPIVENGIWTTLHDMREQILKRNGSIAKADDAHQSGKKIATK